ncbi:MAG: hypothetical protein LBR62_03215, partial [Puniceicoccales bacterium]|nr:hypothetical protein [Puniceicoccales bacterium]
MNVEGIDAAKNNLLQNNLLPEENDSFNSDLPSAESREAFARKLSAEPTPANDFPGNIEGISSPPKPEAISPGDEILMMLQKASGAHRQQVQNISSQMAELGNDKTIEMKDMLKLQNLS